MLIGMVGQILVNIGELMPSKSFYDGFFQVTYIMGVLSIIVYSFIWLLCLPELTAPQMFIKFFPLYLLSMFMILISLIWFKNE